MKKNLYTIIIGLFLSSFALFGQYVTNNNAGGEVVDELKIYPSPVQDVAVISVSIKQAGKVHFDVYNLLGSKVHSLNENYLSSGKHALSIDLSSLEKGVYILVLKTKSGSKAERFYKK